MLMKHHPSFSKTHHMERVPYRALEIVMKWTKEQLLAKVRLVAILKEWQIYKLSSFLL